MRLVLASATAAVAVVLTACSSSGGGTSAPPVVGSLSAGTANTVDATPSATPAGASTTAIDPCHVLTTAQVQALLQPKITGSKAATQPLPNNKMLRQCLYATESSSSELTVGVYAGADAATIYGQYLQSEDGPTSVAGVGDKAYRADEDGGVTALHGDVMCTVDLTDEGDVPGANRLYDENGHHTDIGAPAFDTIAAAAGTLCNRIFGSGTTTPDLGPLATLHPPAPTS